MLSSRGRACTAAPPRCQPCSSPSSRGRPALGCCKDPAHPRCRGGAGAGSETRVRIESVRWLWDIQNQMFETGWWIQARVEACTAFFFTLNPNMSSAEGAISKMRLKKATPFASMKGSASSEPRFKLTAKFSLLFVWVESLKPGRFQAGGVVEIAPPYLDVLLHELPRVLHLLHWIALAPRLIRRRPPVPIRPRHSQQNATNTSAARVRSVSRRWHARLPL